MKLFPTFVLSISVVCVGLEQSSCKNRNLTSSSLGKKLNDEWESFPFGELVFKKLKLDVSEFLFIDMKENELSAFCGDGDKKLKELESFDIEISSVFISNPPNSDISPNPDANKALLILSSVGRQKT